MEKLRAEKLKPTEKSLEELRREADMFEREAEMYQAKLDAVRKSYDSTEERIILEPTDNDWLRNYKQQPDKLVKEPNQTEDDMGITSSATAPETLEEILNRIGMVPQEIESIKRKTELEFLYEQKKRLQGYGQTKTQDYYELNAEIAEIEASMYQTERSDECEFEALSKAFEEASKKFGHEENQITEEETTAKKR